MEFTFYRVLTYTNVFLELNGSIRNIYNHLISTIRNSCHASCSEPLATYMF